MKKRQSELIRWILRSPDVYKRQRQVKRIVLCYREADQAAAHLYRSLGFAETGERDEDEILMELIL